MKVEIEIQGLDRLLEILATAAGIAGDRLRFWVRSYDQTDCTLAVAVTGVVLLDGEPTVGVGLHPTGAAMQASWWGTNMPTTPEWETAAMAIALAATGEVAAARAK